MISDKDINKIYPYLFSAWNKKFPDRDNYQVPGDRLFSPIKIINELTEINNLYLLDLGCNAGLISIVASQIFKKVFGIDRKKYFIDKADISKTVFENFNYNIKNIEFTNINFEDYVLSGFFKKNGMNAIIGLQVLHHMTKNEIDILEDVIKNVKLFITSGYRKRKTGSWSGLHKTKIVAKFLEDNGFNNIEVFFEKSQISIFVAKK